MVGDDWGHVERRVLGMQLGNYGSPEERILLLLNASEEDVAFKLPKSFPCGAFRPVFDTARADGLSDPGAPSVSAGGVFPLPAQSLVLLQHES
jgi:pullulanase/glycogen debranching enzyme